MTRESILYAAEQKAKDIAFKLVPKAASTGYTKAYKTFKYIQGSNEEPKFSSMKKQQIMKAARIQYMAAVSSVEPIISK